MQPFLFLLYSGSSRKYQEAADRFSQLILAWQPLNQEDPEESMRWVDRYFHARCGIARILTETDDPRAITEVRSLYDMMTEAGYPSDYEPLENVTDLLEQLTDLY